MFYLSFLLIVFSSFVFCSDNTLPLDENFQQLHIVSESTKSEECPPPPVQLNKATNHHSPYFNTRIGEESLGG